MCLPNTSNTVITLDKEKNQVGSTFMSYLFLFSSHIRTSEPNLFYYLFLNLHGQKYDRND